MGHQANLAHCYKFQILQMNLEYTIFYNIILGLWKTRNSQDRFPAIQCVHVCMSLSLSVATYLCSHPPPIWVISIAGPILWMSLSWNLSFSLCFSHKWVRGGQVRTSRRWNANAVVSPNWTRWGQSWPCQLWLQIAKNLVKYFIFVKYLFLHPNFSCFFGLERDPKPKRLNMFLYCRFYIFIANFFLEIGRYGCQKSSILCWFIIWRNISKKASEKMLTQKPLFSNFLKTSFLIYLFWCIFS